MKLSDFELEVMTLFWDRGKATAPEIHQEIAETRQVAYSTVKTIIDRLEEKGALLRATKYGRTILYAPAIERESLSRPMVRSFIHKLFGGNVRPLFNHLIRDESLSLEDVDELQRLLSEKRRDLEAEKRPGGES